MSEECTTGDVWLVGGGMFAIMAGLVFENVCVRVYMCVCKTAKRHTDKRQQNVS